MTPPVVRLVGVYDADGSLRGELAYALGKRLGRTSCALCDITHGLVRERADWRACREELPVPFVAFHRDDTPAELRSAIAAPLPYVAGELAGDAGYVLLVDAERLRDCEGAPDRLVVAIDAALDRYSSGA